MGCGPSVARDGASAPAASSVISGSLKEMHKKITSVPVMEQTGPPEAYPEKASLEPVGKHLFSGAVAAKYLAGEGLPSDTLDSSEWTKSLATADKVAAAVLKWAVANGASSFCHWFQPMASTYRHGQAGCVQLCMFSFNKDGTPEWDLSGKDLLRGETDGSSYPNGGLRATHTAGGYLTIDPESPIFLRGDCIYIPACFVSYNGHALDEKTPLHRAVQAMSTQGKRLFNALGVETSGMVNNIGLEQEFFLIPRDQYYRRPDLQMTGRTLMGKLPARGQEGCDHYMAPMHGSTPAFECIKELQQECYKVGIPLLTRHREVAPNQYEVAPKFGTVVTQTDQNLVVMQILDEVAKKHGLYANLIEKPFAGVNGSGKHNNWSISTKEGAQLLNPGDLMKKTGKPELFPICMAAIVAGLDTFGDLMRLAIASPGNDFRLGAMEAPPAVMSTYLGKQMTDYLLAFADGKMEEYQPKTFPVNLGAAELPIIDVPAEDRNRTSPFPYGGYRFEFRAVGSSQNVSLVNTVLNALSAWGFKQIADKVEEGEDAVKVAQELIKKHQKVIFNGNGYDPKWPDEAQERGTWRIDSGVDAIKTFTDQKNVDMFSELNIFSSEECEARQTVLLELYIGVVEMEILAMVDMINQHVIPSLKNMTEKVKVDTTGLQSTLTKAVADLKAALKSIHDAPSPADGATLARSTRLELMVEIRKACEEAESMCPADLWTIATYKELFFLDHNKFEKI